ncbi:MAG: aldehyde dehydrogenase family protein [Rhodobacteraceae bacterium]|jgi:succinate-semialdehyde dehydrogenase/glutarate-semialdehyde dehydrogenase|uniref:NAD-dependent succinate-semialdehyde dehydrogenase n=1 Tax=Roseovarius sp. 10 TaxID=3080563 RepID=UPI001937B9D4|nr:NAD-dependent succinate-semialdehyde dehydrogenase [Roseovarius sp. 10]MBE1290198.1 aldehyde dehydrogenase family protein [Paracoccaceae bacterium]MDV7201627.1 NAD-dependent succinate-semialdehyde dehydrogenase [Roseovarius sp. 10]QPI84423.1 NAD-dependent succinate-semialdehyde dehydrogenase [Rhodobacterales bacterium HKCCA1288]
MADWKNWMREANYIAGAWVGADDGATLDVTNPATGEVIGQIPKSGQSETMRAIDAAHAAFPAFAAMDLMGRLALLWKLHDALMDNQDSLAELLTREMGKPLAEAKGEIAIGAQYLRWYAEEARRVKGEIVPAGVNGRRILVTKHPVGVVGMITPWNFPSSMLARKLAPALAVGCTVVAKPSEETPYSGLAWAALAEDVGYPKGVINIVTGDAPAIGGAMMARPELRKVTFTGSTNVGKLLIRQSADTVKKVSMELGGNAPFIVFDDADLDRAIDGVMASKFRNSGQTCVCANRVFVQAGVHDEFVAKLVEKTRALKLGNGMDAGVTQGPLINQAALKKVEGFVEDAKAKGATVATGGMRDQLGGTFFQPTILTGAKADMEFAQEEIFGPVAPVFKFETDQDGIDMANNTRFGLAAYAYTSNLARAMRLDRDLQYGMVGINSGMITTVEAPFGGVKESGLGKEGGSQGVEDYLDTKYVCIDGL